MQNRSRLLIQNHPLITWAISAFFGASAACAQPYSRALNDHENPFDAPIPGFVGPGGDGKVYVDGFSPPIVRENRVNSLFLGWATAVIDYSPANGTVDGVPIIRDGSDGAPTGDWHLAEKALGPVTADQYSSVVSLGDVTAEGLQNGQPPGSLTIQFAEPIRNFTGADFAVFENGLIPNTDQGGAGTAGVFGELAYVEVSSDGTHFARFPSVSETSAWPGRYGSIDPTGVFNLAGKHGNAGTESWGTPFDLEQLSNHPLVQSGQLDLDAVTQVRIVDIPGRGDFVDSRGHPIYDPWVTFESGGADIEAIGAIGQEQTFDEWNAPHNREMTNNADGDPWSHFQEYAFALNPDLPEWRAIPAIERADGRTVLSFPRDERNADVIYLLECQSRDLNADGWREAARIGPLQAESFDAAIIESVSHRRIARPASVGVLQDVRLTLAPHGDPMFFRLRVIESQ